MRITNLHAPDRLVRRAVAVPLVDTARGSETKAADQEVWVPLRVAPMLERKLRDSDPGARVARRGVLSVLMVCKVAPVRHWLRPVAGQAPGP